MKRSTRFFLTILAVAVAVLSSGPTTATLLLDTITISPTTLPGGTLGVAYSQQLTASGGTAPYTFGIGFGSLPPGVTLDAGGLISGTPTASGSFTFGVLATDVTGASAGLQYTLAIAAAITLSPATLPAGTLGAAYSQQLTASGGTAPYRFSIGFGSLPPGVTLDVAGLISGTPTASGSFTFGVLATDATGASAGLQYTLIVAAPITISPTTLPNAISGVAYSQQLTASGGTAPYTFSVGFGALPPGVTLDAGGLISGTPTASGSFTFGVLATDATGGSGGLQYTLVAAAAITISPTTLPNAVSGIAYNLQLTASGGTAPFTFSLGFGALPAGVTLDSSGLLSGTPTASGSFTFGVVATDVTGASGSQQYTLQVAPPPVTITLSPATLPGATVGVAYSQQLSAGGGTAPYRFSLGFGALPPGVTLNSSGLISGTPTASGSFTFGVVATDATGASGGRQYTLVVAAMITLSPTTLQDATAGVAYSEQLSAGGGTAPYSFSLGFGSLPPGVSLDAGGLMSGTPITSGSFLFSVVATDATGATGEQQYTLDVAAAITISPTTLPGAMIGLAYSQQLTASGGTAPFTFSIGFGALPAGVTLDAGGLISGTPTAAGSFTFGVQATDATGDVGGQQYTLDVAAAITITPAALPGATVGVAYSQQLTAGAGTAPFTFSVGFGSLPPGIALSSGGLVSGNPTAAGSFTFGVVATDATGATGGQQYTLDVVAPISISPAALPAGVAGVAYSQQLTASGGTAPYAFSVGGGSLPPGLSLSSGGLFSGTPSTAGSSTFSVVATDSVGANGTAQYTVQIAVFVPSPPVIQSFTPAKGTVGTPVTITGANFTGATNVSFGGGVAATFNVATDTTITASVPLGAPTGPISVTTPGGTAVSAQSFQVQPKIDSFSPTSGLIGAAVTLKGSGFTGTSGVNFAGTSASFLFVDDFTIKTTVPSGAKDGKIRVSTSVGFADSGSQFDVVKPTITSFSPPKGSDGTTVTINGDDLGTTTAVSFNGTGAGPLLLVSAKKVDAIVPPGATTGKITLTTIAGPITSANDFVITPVITDFNPKAGLIGATVTLKGSGFTGTSGVNFAGTSASFLFVDDFTIKATVPSGAKDGKIKVTTADGTAHSSSTFNVINPTMTGFAPKQGSGGTVVSINGKDLDSTTAVSFNGTDAGPLLLVTATEVDAVVPPGATTGKITLTTIAGPVVSADDFVIKPAITGWVFDAVMRGTGTLGARGDVSYAIALWCEPDQRENQLDVAWGGQSFTLTRVVDALCVDGPAPGRPRDVNFDTHRGQGIGSYGGRDGARIAWSFVDGPRALDDLADVTIRDPDGNVVLRVSGVVQGTNVASGTAILPKASGVDPANVVHSVEIDDAGRPQQFTVTRLSESAFIEEPGVGLPKPDAVPEPVLPKIHPDLETTIARGNPDDRVIVVVNLVDPVDVPRLPDLPRGVTRDSPEASAVIAATLAIIRRLDGQRLRSIDAFLRRIARSAGSTDVRLLERFWLVNAFVADVRLGDVQTLAARPEVVHIQPNQLSFWVPPPTHRGYPHGDIQMGRKRIGSDAYFHLTGMLDDSIGLIDTGTVDPDHPLIYRAGQLNGDCVHGDEHCFSPADPLYSTWDCFDHGTSNAAILNGNLSFGPATRGVTDFLVDRWKVWVFGNLPPLHCNLLSFDVPWTSAIVRAFQAGLYALDRTFAVEVQFPEPYIGAVATAANKAFDAGASVLAANGNCAVDATCTKWAGPPSPADGTVRSPAVAHKVLGVGVFNVVDLNTWDYQSRGPAPDGRIKPDIQAPTDVKTASGVKSAIPCSPGFNPLPCKDPEAPEGLKLSFGGTSAATPFAAGAAALMRNWLSKKYNTFDPGATYARMILSGDRVFDGIPGYSNVYGAGHIRLPALCSITAKWGKVTLGKVKKGQSVTPAVEIDIPVALGDSLAAAIWWPQGAFAKHNDIDILIYDPLGTLRAGATSAPSVFERAEVAGPLMPGTWKLKIAGATLHSAQAVYWTADVRGARPCRIPAP